MSISVCLVERKSNLFVGQDNGNGNGRREEEQK